MASNKNKNIDRISNLPEDIIVDKILSRLSLKEAVKTCVLSKKWRSTWVTLPSLEFDYLSELFPTELDYDLDKLVRIIDSVLSLHTGPIHRFMLDFSYCNGNISRTDLDRWTTYLSRAASLKEFSLCMNIYDVSGYEVPSSMYSFHKLTYLHLSWCVLKPPPEFNGFKSLKSLHFDYITMEQLGFEKMISNCPLLESLTMALDSVRGITMLKIHAPKLLNFYVDGVFDDIVLMETFNLFVVSIHQTNSTNIPSGNLVNFFRCLPRIQRLRVHDNFWKNLSYETIPWMLPTPCLHLTFLGIEINLNDPEENLGFLCLLRSSPNLKELELSQSLRLLEEEQDIQQDYYYAEDLEEFYLQLLAAEQDTAVDNNDEENLERFPLYQLQLVEIRDISSSRQEVNIIKLLLGNAPVLEIMSLEPFSREHGFELVEELVRFRRASNSSAEINFRGPAVGQSFMLRPRTRIES